jgi:hypothetical protein
VSDAPSPPRRRLADRLSRPALLAPLTLVLAAALGLSSAAWMVSRASPFGGVAAGPWKAWPKLGSRDVDPYALAIRARTADVPLGIGEGLLLDASADEAGRPLDAACTYRVEGATPVARYWTLTLTDPSGAPVRTELDRAGFTSREVLRDPGGSATIVLSREAAPGNWLRMPESGRVALVLRLYDTPLSGASGLDPASLPRIRLVGCGA